MTTQVYKIQVKDESWKDFDGIEYNQEEADTMLDSLQDSSYKFRKVLLRTDETQVLTTQETLNKIYSNIKENWAPQCEHLMGAIFATNADPYIIEDEDVAYDVAESIYNSKGHTVLTPADGEEFETAMAQLDLTPANKVTEIHVYDIPGGLKVCYPEHWQYTDNI